MLANIISCYTDASYSKFVSGSIIGFKIGESNIDTMFLPNIKNTEAEMIAVTKCIEKIEEDHPESFSDLEIHIYTDCQKVVQKYDSGEYPFNVVVHKMIGHMRNVDKDYHQQVFTKVDHAVRKALRVISRKRKTMVDDNDSLSE